MGQGHRPLRAALGTLAILLILAAASAWASDPAPTPQPAGPVKVLDYLKNISGQQTVAGIHNREPNAQPARQTDRMEKLTGTHPGLWSGDFLFSQDDIANRWPMIRECRKQWEQGSIVQLLLHVGLCCRRRWRHQRRRGSHHHCGHLPELP